MPVSAATIMTALNASHCGGLDVMSPVARTATKTAKSAAKSRVCALTLSTAPSGSNDRVVARPAAENSTIEAIEDRRHAFLLGVQWHAETLVEAPGQLALFCALVEAASGRAVLGTLAA